MGGVKSKMSSSAAPVAPVTTGSPVVEINTCALERTSIASISSLGTLKPTSAPLKYIRNVPAVLRPNGEVAVNWTISEAAYVTVPNLTDLSNASRSVLAFNKSKATTSTFRRPTSEPSKIRLQVMPLNCSMSSSAKLTTPTLPSLANEP